MPDKNYRSIQGEIRLMETKNPFLFPVEVWALNDAPNRNNWQFTNMEANKNQFRGTPLLIAYLYGGKVIGDGHNMKETTDEDGNPRASFTAADAERIVGAISDDPDDIRTEVRDGNTWIVAKGSLWAWYAAEAVDKIKTDAQQGRSMSVSIEALVTEAHMENGIEVEDSYQILGTTILGDHVAPAVEGARISVLATLGDEFKNLKVRAASYCEETNPENTEEKPHNNTDTKRSEEHMYLSKQQLKELQKKFGDTFAVLCAKQSADGVMVLLMRHSDHVFCTYTIGEKDSAIDEGRITERTAQIMVTLSEDDTLCADAAECIDAETRVATERACAAEAENERLTSDLEASRSTVKAMEEAENKRRLSAAKDAATRALSDFNSAREDEIGSDILNDVNADIESGRYCSIVNAEGVWTGDAEVTQRVLALCAKEQMKLDKASANRKKGTHILDKLSTSAVDDGTVMGLLARKGIN